ncbi:MAG: DUF2442 domain-containing protein [Ignavibacteriales bacterium]|nr:DUF2442 domain-containing protein [Ignavibacteriales bacterium]
MNTLAGKKVTFDDTFLTVELKDGRRISTPLDWYPELKNSTVEELKDYHFICRGTGVEWENLDYQLSIESMVIGNTLQRKKAA